MARELLKHGWEITVITLNPDQLIEESKSAPLLNKQLKYNYAAGQNDPNQQNFLQLSSFWQKHALLTALTRKGLYYAGLQESGILLAILKAATIYQKGDFDLVLASGSPFCQFWAAQILSQKIGCPYVLDYRDPWSQNPRLRSINRLWQPLEKSLVQKSALNLCVSNKCQQFLGALNAPFTVLTNGFNPAPKIASKPPVKTADIVYTGRLYLPDIDVLPLFLALKKLKEAQKKAPTFAYYGPHYQYVAKKAAALGLSDLVFTSPPVRREEALRAQKTAKMVLVVCNIKARGTPYTDGIVTGKIFEPIALKKPILLIAPKSNDAVKIIEEIGGGVHFAGNEIAKIASFLESGSFSAPYNEKRLNYSWPTLGRRLDTLLTGVLA